MDLSHKALLIEKYYSLIYWSPDYEEVGFQSGPSQEDINKVIKAIKRKDPQWKTEEERVLLKENEILDVIIYGKVSENFNPDAISHKKSKQFLISVSNKRVIDLSYKQLSWLLTLVYKESEKTAERIKDRIDEIRGDSE
jgi:hypothetical protein